MPLYQERRSPSPLTRSRDYLRPTRRSRNALRRSIIPSIASQWGGIGEGREVIWEGTHQSSQICLVLRRKFFIWLWVVQVSVVEKPIHVQIGVDPTPQMLSFELFGGRK